MCVCVGLFTKFVYIFLGVSTVTVLMYRCVYIYIWYNTHMRSTEYWIPRFLSVFCSFNTKRRCCSLFSRCEVLQENFVWVCVCASYRYIYISIAPLRLTNYFSFSFHIFLSIFIDCFTWFAVSLVETWVECVRQLRTKLQRAGGGAGEGGGEREREEIHKRKQDSRVKWERQINEKEVWERDRRV